MTPTFSLIAVLLAAAATTNCSAADISVHDDGGNLVTLKNPARRIVSLAPHVTELLYAAGGGDKIVGAVSYSDYPEAAKLLPRVGGNRQIDIERVIALQPDLIVVWMHGSAHRQIDMLRKLNVPIYQSEPKKLDDIAGNLLRLGRLMGTDRAAIGAAAEVREGFAALTQKYARRAPVRLFYQVWDKPLYTLSNGSIVSDAMRLCGGVNIFGDLAITAPVVSIEAVLQADPEAIFGTSEKNYGGVNLWRPYAGMQAVKRDNLFTLNGELLNRAGPRMVAGTAALCEKLELARQRRGH
ncbi:cobalamin-binding protein [Massilia eurypsychrophila]|jgi:iron complex transport system substrate-binding protein|uniref:Cobalamin-binding protein n=1 Tax=Massilia eurypsychrophila TaxID=1485217 RepID=A0A2G8T801_9BURK|nr:cobalamin-binding protein [Massilia eurypsychrophila]PIL42093.1 cobalamin-binding protein [Massilia eurypsychrophila]